jgi:hypothetical protein
LYFWSSRCRAPLADALYLAGIALHLPWCSICAHVAQLVEHLHGKQKVSGSIPLVGSTSPVCFRACGKDRLGNRSRGHRNTRVVLHDVAVVTVIGWVTGTG